MMLPWNQKKKKEIIYCNNCKYYLYVGSLYMLALDVAQFPKKESANCWLA